MSLRPPTAMNSPLRVGERRPVKPANQLPVPPEGLHDTADRRLHCADSKSRTHDIVLFAAGMWDTHGLPPAHHQDRLPH